MAKPERYWSKKSPEGTTYDVIVIGSGMGGMTTASMLARLGRKVLVLEQHYVPGGFTHVFSRKGFTWDVGVHAIGEVTEHAMTGRVLSWLSQGELTWSSLGSAYEHFHFPDGMTIDFPDNPAQFRQNLIDAFPNEVESIDAYLAKVRKVAHAMKSYYMARIMPSSVGVLAEKLFARQAQKYLTMTTKEVIDGITDNPRLRAVLCGQWGYYGSVPSKSSFAMQALVAKHFMWGGYYPDGGSAEIARTLLKTVADNGGWTRICADVEEILLEDGVAVGVRVNGEELRAGCIVSACGILSTVERLLPPPYNNAEWAKETKKLDPAPAHLCLYLGFEGDIREGGASGANEWFYDTWDMEIGHWLIDADEPVGESHCLYCSFPSLKDPRHDPGPDQRHTGEVVTFVPYELFEKWEGSRWRKRGDEYEQLKERIHDAMLKQYFKKMPELEKYLVYSELSTPISTHWFCRPMRGSIYGLEPTPERFENTALRPKSEVKNLFFSGCEVTTVGVMGAMMGGLLCAAAIDPRGVFNAVREAGS